MNAPRTLVMEMPNGRTRSVPMHVSPERVMERYRAALLPSERIMLNADGWTIVQTNRDGTETRTRYRVT